MAALRFLQRGSDRMSYAEFLARKTGRVEKPGARSSPTISTRCCTTGRTNWCAGRCAPDARRCGLTPAWARLSCSWNGRGFPRIKDRARRGASGRLSADRARAAKLGIGAQYVREWSDVDPYDDHLATVYGHKANADYGHLLIETEMGDWVFVYTGSTPSAATRPMVRGVDPTADQMRPSATTATAWRTDWRNDAETTGRSGCYRGDDRAGCAGVAAYRRRPGLVPDAAALAHWAQDNFPASRPSEGFAQTNS